MDRSTGSATTPGRLQPVDRLVRVGVPKIPSTTHRHLLAQRLHRLAAPASS